MHHCEYFGDDGLCDTAGIYFRDNIFPLTVGKPVCCQTLHSLIRTGGTGGNYELSSRCRNTSSDCTHQYFKKSWKKPLYIALQAMQLFLSATVFFPGLIVAINMLSFLWGVSKCRTTTAAKPKAAILKGKGAFARSRALSHSV